MKQSNLIVFTLLLFYNFRSSLAQEIEYELQFIGDVTFDLREVVLLEPRKIMGNEDFIIWGEEESIKLFKLNGEFITEYRKLGRGPGEYQELKDFELRGQNLYAYDNSLKKIMKFVVKADGFELQKEAVLNVINNRSFTVDEYDNIYFLLNHNMIQDQHSISKFDVDGNPLQNYGRIPTTAHLGRGLMGGGITKVDQSIYYSYLGDPTLYELEMDSEKIVRYNSAPDYFTKADEAKVEKAKQKLKDLILYAYQISRVKQVIGHKDFVIQVVEDGGAGMGRELEYFLEVWHNHKKVASKLKVAGGKVFSDGTYLYTLRDVGYLFMDDLQESEIVLKKYLLKERLQ